MVVEEKEKEREKEKKDCGISFMSRARVQMAPYKASSEYKGLIINLLVQALYHPPNLRIEWTTRTVTAGSYKFLPGLYLTNDYASRVVRVGSVYYTIYYGNGRLLSMRQPNPSLLS